MKVSLPNSESGKLLCVRVSQQLTLLAFVVSRAAMRKLGVIWASNTVVAKRFFPAPNSILEIWRRPVAHWNRLGESYRAMGTSFPPTPLLHVQKHANVSKNRPRGVSRLSMKMVVFGPKMVDSGGK